MSKYIIELGEDANMVQAINVTQNGNVYVGAKYVTELKELNADYINEHFSDLQDTAYKKGLEDGKAVNDKGCEGCMYQDKTIEHHPCGVCCNAYYNQWTAKKEEIGVGDVVKTYNGITFVVTKATIDGIVVGFEGEGNTCRFALSEVTRTGEHYNINEILGGLCDD